MQRYTLDASGLVRYFVDLLPSDADAVVSEAFAGEAVLELPAIAAAEAMYIAYNREEIAGRPFKGSPEDVVTILKADNPIVVAGTDLAVLEAVLGRQDEFPSQLHDAMIIATHEVSETEAVITGDGKIADHVPTVWD
jgi:predicted nucleic acid-binding protein